MAVPANVYTTNATVGIREDLSEMLYLVEREETPFTSSISRKKATQTNHEWQTEALAAASTANAHIQGDDTTPIAASPTTRLGNYTQIAKKAPAVSETNKAVTAAGRANEMAHQVWKATKEIKRDIEAINLANQAKVAGDSVTAGRLAGVPAWITTATSAGSGGSDPTGDGTDARTDGTQRAFTEAQLLDVLQTNWSSGGKPDCIMVGPFNKLKFAGFNGRSTTMESADSRGIVNTVDWYVSPFSSKKLAVIANEFQRARDVLVLQKDMWAMAPLRPLKNSMLAKTGDSEKRELVTEWTIEACNEKSSAGVFDTTTS